MAFPTVESVTSSQSGSNVTSFNFSLDNADNSGDLLLAAITNDHDDENQAVSGWTQIANQNNASGIWAKVATGSEGATATVTIDTSEHIAVSVWRISGWSGTIADIEASHAAGGGSTTLDPPSLTPAFGSDDHLWLVYFYLSNANRTLNTWPTNYTSNQTTSISGSSSFGCSTWSASRELAASSEDPGTATFDNNMNSGVSGAYTIVIPPAAAAAGGFPWRSPVNHNVLLRR